MGWFTKKQEVAPEVRVERVEVEVERLVPVGDSVVDVFTVESKSYKRGRDSYWSEWRHWVEKKSRYKAGLLGGSYNFHVGTPDPGPEPKKPEPPEWSGRVYRSCAQAFAEIGADADLTQHKALIVGDKAYLLDNLVERPLAPKPKVAKGKRGAR